MTKQNTNSSLIQVRDMLRELMKTEGSDKFMRARLTVSLAMVNAMIAAHNAGKAVQNNIRAKRRRTKSR